MFRKEYFPENSIYTVSVMGPEQEILFPIVLKEGGHIRVGTEDYPYLKKDQKAKDSAEIVKKWVNLAKLGQI